MLLFFLPPFHIEKRPHGFVADILNYDIVRSEFVLKRSLSDYCPWERYKPSYPARYIISLLFYKGGFGIKFDMIDKKMNQIILQI